VLAELEPLAMSTAAYAVVIALGLLWGSFANVCIYRCPAGRSVVTPGSHCIACQAPIRWYDNVPVLAWLWLRGQCRACKAAFSPRYLVVEAVTGALFGFRHGLQNGAPRWPAILHTRWGCTSWSPDGWPIGRSASCSAALPSGR
jgi:leader peptidase (prepilin peptidase)/N-methyltransferase